METKICKGTKKMEGCGKKRPSNMFRGGRNICKSCKAEYNKKYNSIYKEEIRLRKRVYRETHKDEISDYQREYAKTHKEQKKINDARDYLKHREARLKRQRAYNKNNRGKRNEVERKRRATQKNVEEYYTKEQEEITRTVFKQKCFNCNGKNDLCVDHFYPLSEGFALSLGNAILLCRGCNSKKWKHMPEKFFKKSQIKKAKELIKKAVKLSSKLKGKISNARCKD